VNDQSSNQTSPTLLTRLLYHPTDQPAWTEFVQRYEPILFAWCRGWKLRQEDAEEVTQAVLVKLVEKMRTFTYDSTSSFRAYLKTLARYAWCDLLQERRRPGAGSGDSKVSELLLTVAARDDLEERLKAEFDQALLEKVTQRVRERVQPHTWDAFQLTAVERLSGAEAAERLGLTTATVFNARSKV
jgi:RNA polymerase sigma factor (sigma-70 family)